MTQIECTMLEVREAIENIADYFLGIIDILPRITRVELVEQTPDSVIIRTNEGIMKRTNITKHFESDCIQVEYDEEYEIESKVTTKSHFLDIFEPRRSGVKHNLTISDIRPPGFFWFLRRKFTNSDMGEDLLIASKTYFEMKRS